MSRVKVAWAHSKQKQAWRRALDRLQDGVCAGCGKPFGAKKRGPESPYFPTLDHVEPRSWGGRHVLENFLLKHRACNEARRDAPPTGCDRIWQSAIAARRSA